MAVRISFLAGLVLAALVSATEAAAAEFGNLGGPEPANLASIGEHLREDPYDLELLISFGTSKGGSAGHLALAVRNGDGTDERVYSANFYADRSPEHATGFYTQDLMVGVPKLEYLFGTTSSLGENASFGLDFGEIYKRSVVGVRVHGVAQGDKDALTAFFARINADYHARNSDTEYHDGEVKYDYMRLNCAKTIGSAFKFGAGYRELDVTSPRRAALTRLPAAVQANIPTEMALKLISEWNRRGYGIDVVLYRKYGASTYIDPHDEEQVAFKDLPNRFPSVLSRDFRRDEGAYRDFDNLYAMYLLYNLGKYSLRVNEESKLLEIGGNKHPMAYGEAAELAKKSARSDSRSYRRHLRFQPRGIQIGETPENAQFSRDTAGSKAD